VRTFRPALFILVFFLPLVIQAEPFGTTEVTVYDTDFLPAPDGPSPEAPEAPVLSDWVVLLPEPDLIPFVIPPIPFLELPS
jgi:hypothetical protein